ncbi:unnamed protein product [Angiostrongylus costaricensis]|uniref:Transthyretin-like family protein n=1 Tax=Angiostrongylus costaricensis TaxID=334426 RepID=A0A0R3PZT2_ANGCS|nr:unnamed protein product [Angiostrongylus costaricensis]
MSRLFAVGSLLFVGVALRDQSIAVKGRLTCGAKPAADVLVKLWDEDIVISAKFYCFHLTDVNPFSWLDPHDLLDLNHSNSNGEFQLAGATTEFTAMEPVLSVYHDCNDGIKSGVRKLSIGLPDQYITAGRTPLKTVDIGIINLELSYKKEERVDDDEEEILTK